jgi:RHS repeat-associated protein
VEAGGSPVYRLELSHDALGRVVATTETVLGQTRWRDYGYDEAGRLATIASQGNPLARIGYDANGNRTRLDQQTVAQFDEQDRLVQQLGVQFSFNDAGQLRARTDASGTTHYRYDLWGRLLEVTRPDGRRIAYVHDAAGRRVARRIDGQTTHRWVWQDSLRIAAEVDATGNTVARYIHGDRPNVPEAMLKNGKTWRLVSDHLGSVRLVIDATTGQVAQRIDYDEWGQVLSDSNPGFQPFGYAGGLYDPDTGLVRFGVRDYDAATGRWTTKDPIGFEGGDSNLYGYVAGNPVTRIDPEGLFGVPTALIGASIDIGKQMLIEGKSARCVNIGSVMSSAAFGLFSPGLLTLAKSAAGKAGAAAFGLGFKDLAITQAMMTVNNQLMGLALESKPWTIGDDCACNR